MAAHFIGTPTRDIKEYCVEEWIKSVKRIKGDWFLYIVDNSDDDVFYKRLLKLTEGMSAEVVHLENMKGLESEARLVQAREEIRRKFLESDSKVWFSLESDIIAPPNTLEVLLPYLEVLDVVNHTYPTRGEPDQITGGIGCSLFRREILERITFDENGGYGQCGKNGDTCYYGGDGWLMSRIVRAGYKVADITGLFKLKHLG